MTMSLVPLARLLVMLRNNMMGQPSCKCSSWGGTPEKTECVQKLSGVNAMLLPMHHRIHAVIHAVLCGPAIMFCEYIFVIDEFIECIHIFV
jgi:hypothetical protein